MDEEDFWLRHLRLGVVVFAVGTVVALLYVAFGDPLRPRHLLLGAGGAVLSTVAVAVLPHRAIARSRHRHRFFYGWTAFSIAYLLVICAVDGGASSPMAMLLVLPVIYCGLAYPPMVVVSAALAAGAGFLGLAALGPDVPVGTVVVLPGTLVCTGVTAAAVARTRERSMAQLLALHRRLEAAARYDGLTGCLARSPFQEAVAQELTRSARLGRGPALVLLDLDDLKALNDLHGHRAGDERLRLVGSVLQTALRAVDVAGRLGGDEFAVLLPESGEEAAAAATGRLCEALERHAIAASVGTAVAVAGDDVDALVARADAAMYSVKRARKAAVLSS